MTFGEQVSSKSNRLYENEDSNQNSRSPLSRGTKSEGSSSKDLEQIDENDLSIDEEQTLPKKRESTEKR